MSTTTAEKVEVQHAADRLREWMTPGDTVWTVLDHVSDSGMTRWIRPVIVVDGEPRDVSWLVARVLGEKMHPKHDGVKRGGCGMDMGFDLVYSLSWALFSDGYALKHRWL